MLDTLSRCSALLGAVSPASLGPRGVATAAAAAAAAAAVGPGRGAALLQAVFGAVSGGSQWGALINER